MCAAGLCAVVLPAVALGQDTSPAWKRAEAGVVTHQTRLTSPKQFIKAGEAYFSPGAAWIIFQAVASDAPEHAPYAMYVAKLERSRDGHVTGLGTPILLSEPGSSNTCGWFHPQMPYSVIFGSTVEPFTADHAAGYQRDSSDYRWMFPETMDVVSRTVPEIFYDTLPAGADHPTVVWGADRDTTVPLWERPGYDAECAYSPDGRYIVHTEVDPSSGDGDIFIFDTTTGVSHPIVTEPGYDGGPFFSPDGTRICYRSDRRGNDELQLFVGDLAFDADGVPTLARERAITDNEHVNWAPYWDPSGSFLVYTTSEQGHHNYEVYSIGVPAADAPETDPSSLPKRRITNAAGFDGMPVISADGSLMMWTSQRQPGSDRAGSSQVWVAEIESLAP